MINWLHSKLHRPEKGWDPVDPAWAQEYAAAEWQMVDHALLDKLDAQLGGLQGKRILDMGAGAGNTALPWHDISHTYQRIAQEKAAAAKVELQWSSMLFGCGKQVTSHVHHNHGGKQQ